MKTKLSLDLSKKVLTYFFMAMFAASFSIPFFSIAGKRTQALEQNLPASAFGGNDGHLTSSFVLNVLPYDIFSQEYHLYFLRAKRNLIFGFPDNVLNPSASTGKDFRYLIQTFALAIPAFFGERLENYAIIYFVYLFAALWITTKAFKIIVTDDLLSLLLTTFIVIIEVQFYFLRMSTDMIAYPLFLLGVIMMLDFIRSLEQETSEQEKWFPPILILIVLSLLQMWSFLVLLAFGGTVTGWIFLKYFLKEAKDIDKSRYLVTGLKFAGGLLLVLFFFRIVTGPTEIDIMLRSGFHNLHPLTFKYLKAPKLILYAVVLQAILLLFRGVRDPFTQIFFLAIFAMTAMVWFIVLHMALEDYQTFHFEVLFRLLMVTILFCGLFSQQPVFMPWLKRLWQKTNIKIENSYLTIIRKILLLVIYIGALIYLLLIPWNFFNKIFSKQYLQFAHPRVYEELREYIDTSIKDQRGKSLLTVSQEANHFLAFRTKFDMLLPQGFPLHSRLSTEDIMNRTLEIASFIRTTPQSWNKFLQLSHPNDQYSWMRSRVLSEGQGYFYYLFHRLVMRKEFESSGQQSIVLKQEFLKRLDSKTMSRLEPPDFILVEDVFRALVAQVPKGYEEVFQSGNMTLYKRQ